MINFEEVYVYVITFHVGAVTLVSIFSRIYIKTISMIYIFAVVVKGSLRYLLSELLFFE